jgi:NADH dehydrogenase [ubiquinone] 1 alpha subcomplex assembly factor 7
MTPLGREIAGLIEQEGPIDVARYMALCLGHPVHGYYATRDPFGAGGDFTTAPEISQMFGELIGLWCAAVWAQMGAPERVALIELGPGRGTLMADMLRVAKAAPGFREAIEVVLVETSPTLRQVQARTLADADVCWAATVEEALAALPPPPLRGRVGAGGGAGSTATPEPRQTHSPSSAPPPPPTPPRKGEGRTAPSTSDDPASAASTAIRDDAGRALPAIIIANEFFDALPIRQFLRTPDGWRERLVGLDDHGALTFGLAAERPSDVSLPDRPVDSILEICPEALSITSRIAAHLAAHGGAALAIDYGAAHSSGDTLQAVKAHAFADPLAEPGEADLTAHVDFGALAAAARRSGAAPMALVSQGELLARLGLAARAERLSRTASEAQREDIASAAARLSDRSPTGMGALFKALAFADPRLGALPGFSSSET